MELRALVVTLLLVPWAGCHAQEWSLFKRTPAGSQEDVAHPNQTHMEAKKPKTKVTRSLDSAQMSADEPDTTPAAVTKDDPGSVYCEEVLPDMTAVPPLPKETSYLYARYNHIAKIGNADFADSPTLKRIDLTGNMISEIEDGAFSKLLLLEELALAENRLVRLPMLPPALTTFNANHNQLRTKGLKANAFKKLTKLAYLYLGDNQLEAVPHLPESLRVVHLQNNNITAITDMTFCKGNTTRYLRTKMDVVRLDGNPVGLGVYPNSFICLRTLPIGRYY
ncbi:osteoglycin, paralog b isoform X3 [Conger conger]|uniref:osteoglycin, paralog b isoform X3 n=1 Tax=Conger conger TaxID=82655 RepID=UPI002A5AC1D9|nr:osteoglycin, paralog b isoform X3 [Conger conger]